METVLLIFTMYLSGGIAAGYVYELKKKLILTGMAGTCGIFSIAVFLGASFPQLEGMLGYLSVWITKIGNGGLGFPVGFIVGQSLAGRLM